MIIAEVIMWSPLGPLPHHWSCYQLQHPGYLLHCMIPPADEFLCARARTPCQGSDARDEQEVGSLAGCGCWTSLHPAEHLVLLALQGLDSTWVSRDSALISVPGTGNFVLKTKQVRVTGNVSSALSTVASRGFARHWYKLLHLLHDGELADEQRGDCLLNWAYET